MSELVRRALDEAWTVPDEAWDTPEKRTCGGCETRWMIWRDEPTETWSCPRCHPLEWPSSQIPLLRRSERS